MQRQFGNYTLGERLGIGGMAEVLEATHPEFGRVALKRMLPALKGQAKFVAMFEDEARMTAAVKHSNVVHVHEYSHFEGEPFLALELIDGPDVSRIVRSAARKELSWSLDRALALPYQLLSGLNAIHTCRGPDGHPLNLVHRDISPGNLILQSSGGLKIGDFGIVAGEDIERRTEPGQLKGKLGYMSPEQTLGESPEQASDLYSAGIIAAELFMLRPLFRGIDDSDTLARNTQGNISNWTRYAAHLPKALHLFIQQALHKDPTRRYQSAQEMLIALNEASGRMGLPVTTFSAHFQVAETLREIKSKSGSFRATDLLRALSSHDSRSKLEAVETAPQLSSQARAQGPSPQLYSPVTEGEQRLLRSVYSRLIEFTEAKLSARIIVSNSNSWLEVLMSGGSISSCLSSEPGHQLGELLVQEGAILPAELPKAIQKARTSGLRLGEYLVREKKVRASAINRLLQVQACERLALWVCQRSVDIEVIDETVTSQSSFETNCSGLLTSVLRKNIDVKELSAFEALLKSKRLQRAPSFSAHDYQEQLIDMACSQAEFRILNLIPAAHGVPMPFNWYQDWQQERIATRRQILTALWLGLEYGLLSPPSIISKSST